MEIIILYSIVLEIYRGVAQVVARYFREVEAAGSSPVTPIKVKTVNEKCYFELPLINVMEIMFKLMEVTNKYFFPN